MEALRVFISGTIDDMQAERDAVSRAIEAVALATGIRAEKVLSQIQSPRDWILEQIRACNIYLGIYSHRYGWMIPEEKISVTEFEFDMACQLRKPILVWIRKARNEEVKLPDFENQRKFLGRVSNFSVGYLRQEFEEPSDLEKSIADALRETLIGIIRKETASANVPSALVQILLPGEFKDFTKEKQESLTDSVAGILHIPRERVLLLHVSPGSVIVTIELPREAAVKLVKLVLTGDPVVRPLSIKKIELQSVVTEDLSPETYAAEAAALRDQNDLVRLRAVETLGNVGDWRAAKLLLTALRDPWWNVREQAIKVLARIGAPAVAPLVEALRDPDSDVRRRATETLQKVHEGELGTMGFPEEEINRLRPEQAVAEDLQRRLSDAEQQREELEKDKRQWKAVAEDLQRQFAKDANQPLQIPSGINGWIAVKLAAMGFDQKEIDGMTGEQIVRILGAGRPRAELSRKRPHVLHEQGFPESILQAVPIFEASLAAGAGVWLTDEDRLEGYVTATGIRIGDKNYHLLPIGHEIPFTFKRGMQYGALRVLGDSMNRMDIESGDYAIIEKPLGAAYFPQSEDVVAAIVSDGPERVGVLKRLVIDEGIGQLRLEPMSDNLYHETRTYDLRMGDMLPEFIGKVVAVLKEID